MRLLASWSDRLLSTDRSLTILCRILAGQAVAVGDWDAVAAIANRTLVTPALAESLMTAENLPDDFKIFLETVLNRSRVRNARMRAQLVEACHALNQAGILPIAFKGAAFLAQGSNDMADRICADLDLMVHPVQAHRAALALRSIGYTIDPIAVGGKAPDPSTGANFSRDADVGSIDLHVRVKTAYPQLEVDDILGDCDPINLDGAKLLLPSAALHAALIIFHDQLQERDYWRGLTDVRHAVDLHHIFLRQGDRVIPKLQTYFPTGYPTRALEVQVLTLDWLFGLDIAHAMQAGWRVKIQMLRRKIQLKHPWASSILTVLSILADPPLRPNSADRVNGSFWHRLNKVADRLFRDAPIRKI